MMVEMALSISVLIFKYVPPTPDIESDPTFLFVAGMYTLHTCIVDNVQDITYCASSNRCLGINFLKNNVTGNYNKCNISF